MSSAIRLFVFGDLNADLAHRACEHYRVIHPGGWPVLSMPIVVPTRPFAFLIPGPLARIPRSNPEKTYRAYVYGEFPIDATEADDG